MVIAHDGYFHNESVLRKIVSTNFKRYNMFHDCAVKFRIINGLIFNNIKNVFLCHVFA